MLRYAKMLRANFKNIKTNIATIVKSIFVRILTTPTLFKIFIYVLIPSRLCTIFHKDSLESLYLLRICGKKHFTMRR